MVKFTINDTTAHSWSEAFRLARNQGHGEKIDLPKDYAPWLPEGFEPSNLSIPGQANAVYRDTRERDSFQVREYDDKWSVELDHHNPEEGNMLAHAIKDAPGYTIAAIALGAAIFGSSW